LTALSQSDARRIELRTADLRTDPDRIHLRLFWRVRPYGDRQPQSFRGLPGPALADVRRNVEDHARPGPRTRIRRRIRWRLLGELCGRVRDQSRGRRVANASIEGLDAGYSNVGFMGIPMCLLVFGPESAPVSIIATLFTACVLFLFAVVIVEIDLQKGPSFWSTWTKVVSSLLRSPLLIAPVAGLAVGLSGLTLPAPLVSFTTLLGGAASPTALICIGLFLAQERVVIQDATSIGILVSLKLILQPAVTALLAFHVFSMPPLWSHSAVILSALPIGSGPFTIAKLYGLEAGVTSGSILASHVFAVLTVSLLVAWLAQV
jgi:malonate transporter